MTNPEIESPKDTPDYRVELESVESIFGQLYGKLGTADTNAPKYHNDILNALKALSGDTKAHRDIVLRVYNQDASTKIHGGISDHDLDQINLFNALTQYCDKDSIKGSVVHDIFAHLRDLAEQKDKAENSALSLLAEDQPDDYKLQFLSAMYQYISDEAGEYAEVFKIRTAAA